MIPLERTALSSAETWAGDVQPLDEAVDEEPAVTKCCPDRAEEVTTITSCKIRLISNPIYLFTFSIILNSINLRSGH